MVDLAVCETEILHLQKSDNNQWEHINGLEKALSHLVPIWTTVVLTLMGAMTGSALTFAAMMFKFAGNLAGGE